MKTASDLLAAGYELKQEKTEQYFEVYALVLNHMFSKCEDGQVVAVSPTYGDLLDWYNEQLADKPWEELVDDQFHWHIFKPESILRDFNSPIGLAPSECDAFECGVHIVITTPEQINDSVHFIVHKD